MFGWYGLFAFLEKINLEGLKVTIHIEAHMSILERSAIKWQSNEVHQQLFKHWCHLQRARTMSLFLLQYTLEILGTAMVKYKYKL